jgi:hypothetical protein
MLATTTKALGSRKAPSAFVFDVQPKANSTKPISKLKSQLLKCWQGTYVTSMLHVLSGTTNMAQIFDFKFIIPAFADALTKAEKLSRNGHLTIMVLLVGTSNYGYSLNFGTWNDFTTLKYDKYRFETWIKKRYDSKGRYEGYEEIHRMFLGKKELPSFARMSALNLKKQ